MKVKGPNGRIIGLDLARAMAIIGMMIVNYKLAMEAQNGGPQWLRSATELFEGRASALFVILAGVGVSLMAARARASGEVKQLKEIRRTLLRRAAFLFLAGIGLLVMGWSADILHYYALFIALSALLLRLSDKTIFTWIILILITTEIQLIYLDYSYGWSENYHEYIGLWTWSGFVRNLLFNGFHPFFPWFGFFLLGLWIGRKDWLKQQDNRNRLLGITVVITIMAELFSHLIIRELTPGLGSEATQSLFGTKPMPPNLIYFCSAAASALSIMVLCIQVGERWKESRWMQALVSTGQLSLTHYVAHIVLGLVPLQWLGLLENGSVVFSTIYAFLFYVAMIIASVYWKKRHNRGPLELLMRSWE